MPKLIRKNVLKPQPISNPFSIDPDCLFFSDLHLHDRKEFSRVDPVTGLNSRLMEGLGILDRIEEICNDHSEIKAIFFLGDVFELKDRIPNHILIEFKNRIAKSYPNGISSGKKVFILCGNHDFNVQKYSSLLLFDRNFVFIERPTTILGLPSIFFIPFQRNYEDFENHLRMVEEFKLKPDVVCFHQDIPGGIYETGKKIPGEFKLKLDPNILYLSGHLHKPQRVHGIQFLGSPYETKFSDEAQDRFIWLYNSKTKQLAPLSLRYSKFVSLDFYGFNVGDTKEIVNGNYVRITGDVYKEDLTMKDKKALRTDLEKMGAKAVVFATKFIQPLQTEILGNEKDDASVIRQYAEKNVGTFDLERLVKVGTVAYENAI